MRQKYNCFSRRVVMQHQVSWFLESSQFLVVTGLLRGDGTSPSIIRKRTEDKVTKALPICNMRLPPALLFSCSVSFDSDRDREGRPPAICRNES